MLSTEQRLELEGLLIGEVTWEPSRNNTILGSSATGAIIRVTSISTEWTITIGSALNSLVNRVLISSTGSTFEEVVLEMKRQVLDIKTMRLFVAGPDPILLAEA